MNILGICKIMRNYCCNQEINQKKFFESKSKSIYKTRNCRFLESKRLKFKQNISLFTRTSLTIVTIFVSIIILSSVLNFSDEQKKLFTCVSLLSSVTLLVLSFYDSSLNRSGLSEKFHKNATEISKISTNVDSELAKSNIDYGKLEILLNEYEDLIKNSDLNHKTLTYIISLEKNFFIRVFMSFFEYTLSMFVYICSFAIILSSILYILI